METTGQSLIDHWQWAANKGLMNKNTASGLRAACAQVLGSVDGGTSADIKVLNVEDVLTRFQNLRKKDFKPNVLETYKRRFRQAVPSYLSYVEDPGTWKPRTVDRQPRQERARERQNGTEEPVMSGGGELQSTGFVEYPFPLREGKMVRLVLPRDLKAAEVKGLSAFMSSLVVDSDVAGAGSAE